MRKTIGILFLAVTVLALGMAWKGLGSSSSSDSKFPKTFLSKVPLSDGFDFPVGSPNRRGYYNAQPFGKNDHLGEDWNGRGGGNTDLGDPVYATANGKVFFANSTLPGWGNIVRVIHKMEGGKGPIYVESFYAHLDKMAVKSGQIIQRGEKVGTIGTADGVYLAHLHFEIRDRILMPLGRGYSKETLGYIAPTEFIQKHRPVKK